MILSLAVWAAGVAAVEAKYQIDKANHAHEGKTKENKMALITPDFSGDTSGPVVGVYPARVIEMQEKTSQKTGQPYQNWAFELFNADKFTGRRAYAMTTDGAKGREWGIKTLKQLYRAATGEELQQKSFDTESLIGKEVTLTLVASVKPDGTTSDFPEVKAIAPYNQ